MKWRILFALLVVGYLLLLQPFTDHLKTRPVEVKLGYLPHPQLLKAASGEHAPTVAATLMARVLFYFGTILQKLQENVIVAPEQFNMYKTLQTVAHLDPYNMDTYYFAQATFTWETGRVNEVNYLLEQGMKSRTWDYWLPFYLGFNYSYFLKDYAKAAIYMRKAAEISGNPAFAGLASRYFYESQQSALGLAFIETMIKTAKDKVVRHSYELRRDALLAVLAIERARDAYHAAHGRMPTEIGQLVNAGLLPQIPPDPYGGHFFLDAQGRARTTSKLAAPAKKSGE